MFIYKLKAFSWHLLASLVVATVSLMIIFFIWYPSPLYQATGVIKIFLLMLGIDIVLGPLLTFIVFKPNKRTLKFDLSVIVLLQLAAFAYGFYQVYDGRPVWIAYSVDRFDLIKNNEIDTRKLAEASSKYQKTSILGAKYVVAVIPKNNPELSNEILFDEIGSGIAPSQRPELYQPLNVANVSMASRVKDLNELNNYNDKVQVKNILSKYPQSDSFLPLKANAVDMTVLMDSSEQPKVIKIVDLRPW